MFIVCNSRDWKQPKCPTVGDWLNNSSILIMAHTVVFGKEKIAQYAWMKNKTHDIFFSIFLIMKTHANTHTYAHTLIYDYF